MLSRCYRLFSKFEAAALGSNKEPSEPSTFKENIENLANSNFYTTKRISKVIRNLFYTFLSAKREKIGIELSRDPIVIEAVRKIGEFVPTLSPENVILLIRNLVLLKIQDPEIWKLLEESFISGAHEYLLSQDYAAVAKGFSYNQRRRSEIWEILEKKIMNNFYPHNEFTCLIASDLMRTFAFSNQGSEELFGKLKENFLKYIKVASKTELKNALYACQHQRKIDTELRDTVLNHILEIKTSLTNKDNFDVLIFCILLQAPQNYTEVFEEFIYDHVSKLDLFELALLVGHYAKYSKDQVPKFEKKKALLRKIENTYSLNRKSLVESSPSLYPTFIEIRLFWGLSVLDIINEIPLWKEFYDSNILENPEVNPGLKTLTKETFSILESKKIFS